MFVTPFLYEMNQVRIGVRTNIRPSATMILCFRSPYASPLTDHWLGHKMLRIYTAYYKKVMRESRGKFWEECSEAPEKDLYTTFCGGGTGNGNQAEKSKKW